MFGTDHRLADQYWLAMHDSHDNRPLLRKATFGYGLAAALLAEMITDRFATVGQDQRTPGDTTLCLWLVKGAPRPRDQALAELYNLLAADREDDPAESHPRFPSQRFPSEERTGDWRFPGYESEPGGRHAAGDSAYGDSAYGQGPNRGPQPIVPDPQTRQVVPDLLDYLALEGLAERLVVNRLLPSGLVQLERQRRFLRGTTDVVIPKSSVVSGRPLSWINSKLTDDGRRPSVLGNAREPWRLEPDVQVLAALFLATGVYDKAELRPGEDAMRLLFGQLRTDLDPRIRALFFQVEDAVKSRAINR